MHAHDNVGRTIDDDAERIKAAFRADPGAGPEYGYTERDAAEVMATVVRGPDRTFGSNATIDLGDRVVTMTYAGRGHTDGDVAVLVPDTDAMFLGDLVEESAHPSFGDDCWPLEWADTLTSHLVQAADRTVVVPGHGRPVDGAFVARQRDEIAVGRGRDPRAPARCGIARRRRCASRTRACPTRSTTWTPRSAAAGTTSPHPPPDATRRPGARRAGSLPSPATSGLGAVDRRQPSAGDPPPRPTSRSRPTTGQLGESRPRDGRASPCS